MPEANQNASLTINNGNIYGSYYAVVGNGSARENDTVNITVNGGLLHSNATAIYQPHDGTLVINGGELIGADTAIEIRAGKLEINDGVFTAENTTASSLPNGNGTTSTGSAIAIAQHTTKLPITVEISGGEFNGYSAIYESNPQNNEEEYIKKISIKVSGGVFNAINGGDIPVFSEDIKNFITGGTFNNAIDEEYIKEGYTAVKSGSNWVVTEN